LEKIRYNDCQTSRSNLVKEILSNFDQLSIKYNISTEDYNSLRRLVRKKSWDISNTWHYFIARVLDSKMADKVNNFTSEQ